MTNQKSSLKFDRALRFVHEACVDRQGLSCWHRPPSPSQRPGNVDYLTRLKWSGLRDPCIKISSISLVLVDDARPPPQINPRT